MIKQCYSVNQHQVSILLAWIQSGVVAIPDIQRPFVWRPIQVRDFIDSLYRGYPVGYVISWSTPSVRLKDGSQSDGKRILIDGQQRVTALMTALLGQSVLNKEYRTVRIQIAFHPVHERFEVSNPAIRKDKAWVSDISELFGSQVSPLLMVKEHCTGNPGVQEDQIFNAFSRLMAVQNSLLGMIDLDAQLGIETVSEIFVRINSKGVTLNAADFVMSRMAANENHSGHLLRKSVDYFCHLAVKPEAYHVLSQDAEFAHTKYFAAMKWLKGEKADLYDPRYSDMLRVAFTAEFGRGRLEDLVALLSGRNFKTKEYDDAIVEDSFCRLEGAILSFMNQTAFKRLEMILKSAGFLNGSMIRSQTPVNFAYALYLMLRVRKVALALIDQLVRRWYVLTVLTGRYRSGFETTFARDIRSFRNDNPSAYLHSVEQAELSNVFWEVGLPQRMQSPSAASPYFSVFLASMVKANDKGFLSKDIDVQTLLQGSSHRHHVFPKNYLKKHGLGPSRYNQIANLVVMQAEINVAIGDKAPSEYFRVLQEQCETATPILGGIAELAEIRANYQANCLPDGMEEMDHDDYEDFLAQRRRLMSLKIRDYYRSL